MNDSKIIPFRRGNVVWLPYRPFLTWEEKLALQAKLERGELADVIEFPKTEKVGPATRT
jgi:hypothetical protein